MAETPKEILERVREGLRVLSKGAQEPVVKVSAKILLRDLDRLEMTEGFVGDKRRPVAFLYDERIKASDQTAMLLTIKQEGE